MLALRRTVAASAPLVGAYNGLSNRTRKIEKPRPKKTFLTFFVFEETSVSISALLFRISRGNDLGETGRHVARRIREKDLWPKGLYPLPHPNHPEGGMVFPKFHIEQIKKQEGRDLTRFDLDYDLPDHFSAGVPASDLSHDQTGPGQCVQGAGGHHHELLRAL